MNPKDIQALQDFETQVLGIQVKDYGDFKRKSVLYLNRLEDNLSSVPPQIQKEFTKIRDMVQFHPNNKIETTRQKVLQWTQKLRSLHQ